jgi:hypothetical protein
MVSYRNASEGTVRAQHSCLSISHPFVLFKTELKFYQTFERSWQFRLFVDQHLSVAEICQTLQISQATFYRYVALGRRAAEGQG